MYVDTAYIKRKGKRYPRYLLRESYRQDGKVKKRTIATLCRCSEEEIAAIKLALKNKRDLAALKTLNDVALTQGKSIGALHVIQSLAKRLGIIDALGKDKEGKVAFWQLYARLVVQGSRQTSLRLSQEHETRLLSDFPILNEKMLYKNLDWLSKNQLTIEKSLLRKRKLDSLFLYDVTSSYLEGNCNALAKYGYNRDGKKGKKQIVIGLLTDKSGRPVAVRVFEGNTGDTKPFGDQIHLLKKSFSIDHVIIVGDGGMIKSPQQSALPDDYDYITSLSKSEIKTLIKKKVIQLDLFDENLCEISSEGCRYVFRKNATRKQALAQVREEKEASLLTLIAQKNDDLSKHPKADASVALRKIEEKAAALKLHWFTISHEGRKIVQTIDDACRFEATKLDGCYCIKTTVNAETADKTVIHDRYKRLAHVERAFRTMKTQHLEIRPLFLRKKTHTQGHVFVVMLAYLLQMEMESAWKTIGLTVKEGLQHLTTYTTIQVKSSQERRIVKIPTPNATCLSLMHALSIEAPTRLY